MLSVGLALDRQMPGRVSRRTQHSPDTSAFEPLCPLLNLGPKPFRAAPPISVIKRALSIQFLSVGGLCPAKARSRSRVELAREARARSGRLGHNPDVVQRGTKRIGWWAEPTVRSRFAGMAGILLLEGGPIVWYDGGVRRWCAAAWSWLVRGGGWFPRMLVGNLLFSVEKSGRLDFFVDRLGRREVRGFLNVTPSISQEFV